MSRPAIFITGAAAGIGRATAERFASGGWFVGLYDVEEEAVRLLAQHVGAHNAIAGKLDVCDEAAFAAALAQFFAASGNRLDVLFNNAGVLATGDFESIPLARHHLLVDINLKGVINGCQLALPYLQRTAGARAISMCSASAMYGTPAFASYSATKFAVKGLTEALDIEWARHGVRVMDLMPLFVATPMLKAVVHKPKSIGKLGIRLDADDIAATVWAAAHWRFWRRVHWYPGLQMHALAISQRFTPTFLTRLFQKRSSGY